MARRADSTAAAQPAPAAPAGGGAVADTPQLHHRDVTHEAPGDTFWDKIRAGAEAAAAKDNIDLKYSNDPTAVGEATLIQNAVDSKVDGIAVTLLSPGRDDGFGEDRGDRRGHPGGRVQHRHQQYKELGALMYFGSDEDIAGKAVGERIAGRVRSTRCA